MDVNIRYARGRMVAPVAAMLALTVGPSQPVFGQRVASATHENAAAPRVTVNVDDVPLVSALRLIAGDAGLIASYRPALVPEHVRVTLHVRDVPVTDALRAVLRGTDLVAKLSPPRQVLIVRADAGRVFHEGTIAGRVTTDHGKRSLIGATVAVDGTARATTGANGEYRVTGVNAGGHTVAVKMIGYTKVIRAVTVANDATTANDVTLEPAAAALDQVVVTGTIVATELKAIPSAITVVTAKQIEERGITQIQQLFRGDVPGVFAMNSGSANLLDSVAMYSRGATFMATNQASAPIKTYVDGVELANPAYLSQIDPRSIERIEILTGPQASTIYGSNAINGVMQIFTKRGTSPRPEIVVGLSTGLVENNFSAATTPVHNDNVQLSGTTGRLGYTAGASWDYVGAWTPAKQTQSAGGYGSVRVAVGHRTTVDVSARDTRTQNRMRGAAPQANNMRRLTGEWKPSMTTGVSAPMTATGTAQTFGATFSMAPVSWWSHSLVLGTDSYESESVTTAAGWLSPSDSTLSFTQSRSTRTSQQYTMTASIPLMAQGRLSMTLGGDHWRSGTSSISAAPLTLTGTLADPRITRDKPSKNFGGFLQSQLALFDAVFLTYGLRAEWNPGYGADAEPNLTPRYGIAYTRDLGPITAKARLSYGRSTRPPAPTQRFGAPNEYAPYTQIFGVFNYLMDNPNLTPEYQQGGEGGLELYFGTRGSLVVTRYNQTVDGLISSIIPVDSIASLVVNDPLCDMYVGPVQADGHCYSPLAQYLNVGSIRNQGWELQGSVNVGPLTAKGTYSWTKSRTIGITPKYRALLTGTQYQPGRSPDFMPEHTWSTTVSYGSRRSTIALSLTGNGLLYVQDNLDAHAPRFNTASNRSQMTIWRMGTPIGYRGIGPGYTMADVNASCRFSQAIEGILQIHNLSNFYQNDYQIAYPVIGRQSKIGLRIRQ